MKTETKTTHVFRLPSGIEVRISNADPRDIAYLQSIETAVSAEREACAEMADDHGEPDLARNIRMRCD